MTESRRNAGHPNLEPRGLTAAEAAAYIGVGETKFLEMVAAGAMPGPKIVDGAVRYDRRKIDSAWDRLPDRDGGTDENPWDKKAA